MKKMLLVMCMVGLVFTTTACGKNKNNKSNNGNNNTTIVYVGPIANTDSDVISEREIDGLKISNVSFISENGAAVFTATVTNTTEQDVYVKSFNIILKDAEGNQIRSMLGYVGKNLSPNGSYTMVTNISIDINNIASVEYIRNY